MIRALLAGQLTWNIPLLFLCFVLTIVYLKYIKRNQLEANYVQAILFLSGIWLLYVAIGSPILPISYLSFSLHMIQMSFLYFIIPPLLILGIPQAFYQKGLSKQIHGILLASKHALIAFSILFLLYHFPLVLTFVSQFPLLKKGYLIVLFLLAFCMWIPIASSDPEDRLSAAKRKKYLLQSSLYIMPACMMFIISALLSGVSNPFLNELTTHLCLPADSSIQILPAPFNTKYDQIMAGLFMMGLHKVGLQMTRKLWPKC